MQHRINWTLLILLVLVAPLIAACGASPAASVEKISPALVEDIEGSSLHRITLTERAAERLGIQTAAATQMELDGASRLAVPDSAVIYDAKGETWVFVQLETLTFMRVPVVILSITDGFAYLQSGPDPGTEVVVVGAAELYGTDLGVGK
jgi:hypothetical protein